MVGYPSWYKKNYLVRMLIHNTSIEKIIEELQSTKFEDSSMFDGNLAPIFDKLTICIGQLYYLGNLRTTICKYI